MNSQPIPANDVARVAALRSLGVLDTPPEPNYDDLTRLAAQICGVPIALISLVDADRQWFKSRVGLDATETPRGLSFCAHAIVEPQNDVFVVPDASADARFADNVLSPAHRTSGSTPAPPSSRTTAGPSAPSASSIANPANSRPSNFTRSPPSGATSSTPSNSVGSSPAKTSSSPTSTKPTATSTSPAAPPKRPPAPPKRPPAPRPSFSRP